MIGLHVHFVDCRRDAVDAGSTVLAGQPIGLFHPVQVDDGSWWSVSKSAVPAVSSSSQVGYPLSVLWTGLRVGRVQSPLPCFRSTVLSAWCPPSLRRVPASPVPRPHRYYEGTTTSPLRARSWSLMVSVTGPTRAPPVFVVAKGAPGESGGSSSGPEHLISRRSPPGMLHTWARAGSHRFPDDPSYAYALLQDPGRAGKISPWRSCRCCPSGHPGRRPQRGT